MSTAPIWINVLVRVAVVPPGSGANCADKASAGRLTASGTGFDSVAAVSRELLALRRHDRRCGHRHAKSSGSCSSQHPLLRTFWRRFIRHRPRCLINLLQKVLSRGCWLEHEPDDLAWRCPQRRSWRRSARSSRLTAATLSKPVPDAVNLPAEALSAQFAPEPGGTTATLTKTLIQIGAVLIDYGLANTRRRIWIDFGVSELPHGAVIEVELPSEFSI